MTCLWSSNVSSKLCDSNFALVRLDALKQHWSGNSPQPPSPQIVIDILSAIPHRLAASLQNDSTLSNNTIEERRQEYSSESLLGWVCVGGEWDLRKRFAPTGMVSRFWVPVHKVCDFAFKKDPEKEPGEVEKGSIHILCSVVMLVPAQVTAAISFRPRSCRRVNAQKRDQSKDDRPKILTQGLGPSGVDDPQDCFLGGG